MNSLELADKNAVGSLGSFKHTIDGERDPATGFRVNQLDKLNDIKRNANPFVSIEAT